MLVQQCAKRPDLWQIGLTLRHLQDAVHYFLVRDLGNHRYRMVNISTTRQTGCPGEGKPWEVQVPTLFPRAPQNR